MNKRILVCALLCGNLAGIAASARAADLALADLPLFLVTVKPSIMVMLDNSGSMKYEMYSGRFYPDAEYHGIFESAKNYAYNNTITVNSAAYSVTVDTGKTGAFVESNCIPSNEDETCWSGRFLNWLTTRRIDASRKVMVGGKLESTTAFAYGDGNLYKIVANNEYADHEVTKSYAASSGFSPIPDGIPVRVYSPADANNGAIQTSYDPYAKITVGDVGDFIYDNMGNPIGEFGTRTITSEVDPASGYLLSDDWTSVSFAQSYSNPIIIAKPPTFNESSPSLVRIKKTASGFDVSLQEWEYEDGNHSAERVSYVVMEAGRHHLPNGITVEAGSIDTDKEYFETACYTDPDPSDYETVSFASSFSSTPVVISSIMTYNGPEAVASRAWNVSASQFRLALQKEEDAVTLSHPVETLGYIAFEKGSLVDASNHWMLEADSISGVTDAAATGSISFSSSFEGTPALVAAMQTMSESDPATLRLDSLSNTGASVHVEEESSCPGDTDLTHSAEEVGYVALRGIGDVNIALVVPSKPTGLLQDIAPGARLGVSFYRFNPTANDIYYQNIQGGTLHFKIPNNPFVKKPSDPSLPAAERGFYDLEGYIGTDIDDIVAAVNHYPLVWGTTPIAENLWEVIQYFEQDPNGPWYTDVVSGFPDFELADAATPERDPFYYPDYGAKLSCSSPSVVILTDGNPYFDADVPAEVQDYDEDNNQGDVVSSDPSVQGQDNLDDVAHWAYCDRSKGSCPWHGTPDDGSRDLRGDLGGDQYLTIYTVGFADGTVRDVLRDAAYNAGGEAYAAADGEALKSALKQAFADAISRSSFSSVAVNTGSITASSMLYQAVFDSTVWSGDIEAYSVNTDGSVSSTPSWIASGKLPAHTSRHIYTHNGSSGKPFRWGDLSLTQQSLLGSADVLNYLRGDQSLEEANGGTFRDRNKLLGDFINSAPVWVGNPSMYYPDSWGVGAAETPYSTFKSTTSRTAMVYAGSNDGMLHAFTADLGNEVFAYAPAAVYSNLASLANPRYTHKYFTDGSPTVVDAYFSGWHTVLVAGLNAGGQGIYALDVTDPDDFSDESIGPGKVLWEFDDGDDEDLGYTFSQPNVVRLRNGSWAAVFGNGYNNTVGDTNASTTGNAVLYIVNIADGSLIKRIDTGKGAMDDPTGNGRPNGLATVAPVDVNGDRIVDYVYAGDLFGNLWKFNLKSTDVNQWDLAYSSPLFTACHGIACTASNVQPITSRPQVGLHPSSGGYMVYFGTGKYTEDSDNTSASQVTQSFYGIWDKDQPTLAAFNRGNLLQQEIEEEVDLDSDGEDDYRLTSENPIDWSTQMGWYLDLINTEVGNTDNKGERQISGSLLRDGRIIFTTLLPDDNPCSAGGTGWLMVLDASNGARLSYTPFDVDNNGLINEADFITKSDGSKVVASGFKSKVGIIPMPAILTGNNMEFMYTPGTTGDMQTTRGNTGPGAVGRQSWRELDF